MTAASVASARAHTATLVVVGPSSRLPEAVRTLTEIEAASGVRGVLIPTTPDAPPPEASLEDVVAIPGLKPEHVDNAIAALRLSSLPTLIWWRGGPHTRLDGAAALADRVVLDVVDDDAAAVWRRAPDLFERSAITDIRWAQLTRWRAAIAHFFDLPQVRDAASSIGRLAIVGADRPACTLLAGWLDSSLGWKGAVAVEIADGGPAPLSKVVISGARTEMALDLLPTGSCVATTASVDGQIVASRTVALGDQSLSARVTQELRVRSRDLAFERALVATGALGL